MAVKKLTCYTVHCDHCDSPLDRGDYIPHFDQPGEADDNIRDFEWTKLRDGRVYCDAMKCQLEVPLCICGTDTICDADACPPGCPCLLHPDVPPLEPCHACGKAFENHAQRQFHDFTHPTATTTEGDHA